MSHSNARVESSGTAGHRDGLTRVRPTTRSQADVWVPATVGTQNVATVGYSQRAPEAEALVTGAVQGGSSILTAR